MVDLPPYDQLLAQATRVQIEEPAPAPASPPPDLGKRNIALIAGGSALVGAYAYHAWWREGFSGQFHRITEGGFGKDAEFMGIDKLGHMYSGYVGTRLMSPLFETIGNSPESSRRLAAWTTWGVMTGIEVLDGFSKSYSFSHEDFIANTVGVLFGYAAESNPAFDDLVDFRLFYRQSPLSNFDPIGDYPGQRYFLVAKAEGVPAFRNVPVLKYLEVGVGYGAPGVDTPDEWKLWDFAQRRREVFWMVSLNLSRVIADAFYGGERKTTRSQRNIDRFLDMVQHPLHYYQGRNLDR